MTITVEDLPKSRVTASRMGYSEVAAAGSFLAPEGFVELAVIGPGDLFQDGWGIVTHINTDPEDPTAGVSGVASASSRQEAEQVMLEEMSRSDVDVCVPGYLVAGRSAGGSPIWISTDAEGREIITNDEGEAQFFADAEQASNALDNIRACGDAELRGSIETSSLGVLPAQIVARRLTSADRHLSGALTYTAANATGTVFLGRLGDDPSFVSPDCMVCSTDVEAVKMAIARRTDVELRLVLVEPDRKALTTHQLRRIIESEQQVEFAAAERASSPGI